MHILLQEITYLELGRGERLPEIRPGPVNERQEVLMSSGSPSLSEPLGVKNSSDMFRFWRGAVRIDPLAMKKLLTVSRTWSLLVQWGGSTSSSIAYVKDVSDARYTGG